MSIISKLKNGVKKRGNPCYEPNLKDSLNSLSHKCDILEIKGDLNDLEDKINNHNKKYNKVKNVKNVKNVSKGRDEQPSMG